MRLSRRLSAGFAVRKPNPFRLGLRALRRAKSKAVYRFRRRVKRLRVYLALYALPNDPPSSPALDKLFRRAGKLRQAYLHRAWIKAHAPIWKPAIKAEIRYRRRRLLKAYDSLVKEARQTLSIWKKRFPAPWKGTSSLPVWVQQGQRWVELHREALRAFPEPPYTPEQLHQLRTLCRQWELANVWVELPELPPAELTTLLGEARDVHLLWRWLQDIGEDDAVLHKLQQLQAEKEAQALRLWREWRSSWA